MMTVHKTDDVYGISRDLPLNYVSRPSVDDPLIENLTREKHLVIYGSSKQGKTSLRKHCLSANDYIVVQCASNWELRSIHEAILKSAGFKLTLSETKTTSGKAMVLARFELAHERSTTQAALDLDPADVNDIIRALDSISFSKYLVLEDFHYLSTETQRSFAVALKAFHESSRYCFIVVGVWLEENRLTLYNGDLTGRVVAIDADRWSTDQLREVIDKGAALLNVALPESTKERLIKASFSSVYVVQEGCRRICRNEHVYETQSTSRVIGADTDVEQIVAQIVEEQGGRYNAFIREFSHGFQASDLEMYRWLLLPVLTADAKQLQAGLHQRDLRVFLEEHHPVGSSLNSGNVTIALQSVANLQSRKNIKPIVLDYDETNRRLRVVDRGFFAWLAQQDLAELLQTAGFEANVVAKFSNNRPKFPPR
jgi:hypothetical protein